MAGVERALVVGATGTQGGAVVDALESTEISTIGLTRDPKSAPQLNRTADEVVTGDLTEPRSLRSGFERADAVFCVTDYFSAGDPATEIEMGRAAITAAESADVAHFVYSSAMDADLETGVPHFDSKLAIEEALDESALSSTVIRPAPYFQNLEDQRGLIYAGLLTLPQARDTRVPMVDVRDVGAAVAAILREPETHEDEAYDLFADAYSATDLRAAVEDVVEVTPTPISIPTGVVRRTAGEEIAAMYNWFDECNRSDVRQPDPAPPCEYTDLRTYLRDAEWDERSPLKTVARVTSPVRTFG